MNTKLILVILKGGACEKVTHNLHDAGFRVTELSSMGTFLRQRSTTLVIGLPGEQVEQALSIIRTSCPDSTPEQHNATLFVLNAEQSVHF
jgi:uncharacterized protein YaaQ